MDASGSEVGGKKKRGSTGEKDGGAPKQGRGCGGQGSSSERLVVAKVSQSRVDIPKPKPAAPVGSAAGAAGIRQQRVPGLSNVPIVDVDSDDDEGEPERVGSDVGVDEKVYVSSSDGSSGCGDDDDGDEEHGEEIDRR